MNRNIKLYPIYKLFSYDILFYYSVSILYLTIVKSLSFSQVALLSSIYSASAILFQLPATIITDKIGVKNSMILGNIFCSMWGLVVFLSNSFLYVSIAETVFAFGFALNGVSESPFIYSSMKMAGREDEYSKVESKGSTLYFIVESVACIIAGYLYTVNVNLPIIFATICFLTATILATFFKPLPRNSDNVSAREYFLDLKYGFRYIFNSSRLHALLLFSAAFQGVVVLSTFLMKTYLKTFNVDSRTFGYIYAILAVSSAIGCSIQHKLEDKFKNKTLGFYSITYLSTFLFLSIFALIGLPIKFVITIGAMFFVVQALLKGSYRIIIKKYLSRYTTSAVRTKIMSIYYLAEALGASSILYIASLLADSLFIGYLYFVFGSFLLILFIFILMYMKRRVGKSPEAYELTDRIDLVLDESNLEKDE